MKHFFFSMPLGMRYMILSAFGFSLMAVCVKLASADGIPVLEIVAARALVSVFLSYADVRRKRISLLGNNHGLLIARGAVGTLALVCVYYAITHMPLAEATVLQYLHPMFTAVLAIFFLKERLQASVVISIIFSFIGLLLIAKPEFLFGGAIFGDAVAVSIDSINAVPVNTIESLSYMALGAAILGAFGSAVAYVLVRKLSQTEDPSVIIFYFPMIALPFSLFLLGDNFVIPTAESCLILLFVGIFTQVGQVGLTKAMQTETASKATAFSYLQVVFAAILGWAIFNEIPDIWVWLGAGFIMSGAIVNMLWRR